MQNICKKLYAMLFIALLASMMGCFSLCENEEIHIQGAPECLKAGTYIKLTVDEGKKVKWDSSDPSVATVTKEGRVFTKKVNTLSDVRISATSDAGSKAEVTIRVIPKTETIAISVNGVNANGLMYDLSTYEKPDLLVVKTVPEDARYGMKWQSSNPMVAEVDENNALHINGIGSARITALMFDGARKSFSVQVDHTPQSLQVFGDSEAFVGEEKRYIAEINPADAVNAHLRWTSENSSIASVDENGRVIAKRAGTTRIVASCRGNLRKEVLLTVYEPVRAIQFPEKSLEISLNHEVIFPAKVVPEQAKYQTLTYMSDDESVARVDAEGRIAALGIGECRVTCQSDSGVIGQVHVSVCYRKLEKAEWRSPVAAMLVGERLPLLMTYTPEDASKPEVWLKSEDPSVVEIDSEGFLLAKREGMTNVFVYVSDNGGEEPSSVVSVRVCKDSHVPLSGIKIGLNPGHQITRDYTQLPMAPGSKKTGNANSGYAIGIATGNTEYEINLLISLKLREKLEALGAEVVMTRTRNDVKLNNIQRAQMLNDAGVDVAFQIHCDENAENHSNRGVGFYVKSTDLRSRQIAQQILESVCGKTGARSKGVILRDSYMSLNWSETSAILIECGYMSNEQDDLLLNDPDYRDLLATSMAEGIVAYYEGQRVALPIS